MKKKFLSTLMMFSLLLAMIPTALADDNVKESINEKSEDSYFTDEQGFEKLKNFLIENGIYHEENDSYSLSKQIYKNIDVSVNYSMSNNTAYITPTLRYTPNDSSPLTFMIMFINSDEYKDEIGFGIVLESVDDSTIVGKISKNQIICDSVDTKELDSLISAFYTDFSENGSSATSDIHPIISSILTYSQNLWNEKGLDLDISELDINVFYNNAPTMIVYNPQGKPKVINVSQKDVYLNNGWYELPVAITPSTNLSTIRMYAADGRVVDVEESKVEEWKASGWYNYPVTAEYQVITMYSADGRTALFNKSKAEEWKALGWYEYPVITMYAPDGRTAVFEKSKAEEWKAVGWYYSPVITMYAPNGDTTVVAETAIEEWKGYGWREPSLITMYNVNGKATTIDISRIDELKSYGWSETPVTPTFYLSPFDILYGEILSKNDKFHKSFSFNGKIYQFSITDKNQIKISLEDGYLSCHVKLNNYTLYGHAYHPFCSNKNNEYLEYYWYEYKPRYSSDPFDIDFFGASKDYVKQEGYKDTTYVNNSIIDRKMRKNGLILDSDYWGKILHCLYAFEYYLTENGYSVRLKDFGFML